MSNESTLHSLLYLQHTSLLRATLPSSGKKKNYNRSKAELMFVFEKHTYLIWKQAHFPSIHYCCKNVIRKYRVFIGVNSPLNNQGTQPSSNSIIWPLDVSLL